MANHPNAPKRTAIQANASAPIERPTYDQKGAMKALGMSYAPFMRQYRAGGIPTCFPLPKDGSWPRGGRAPKAAIDRLATEGLSMPGTRNRFA